MRPALIRRGWSWLVAAGVVALLLATANGQAQQRAGGAAAGVSAERGKYLFRIARLIAERSRELAVVETLDNGKPIKETRDFDVPTTALIHVDVVEPDTCTADHTKLGRLIKQHVVHIRVRPNN